MPRAGGSVAFVYQFLWPSSPSRPARKNLALSFGGLVRRRDGVLWLHES